MSRLYGDGKPLKLPTFVTGWETPDRKLRRLRETNGALKKNQEREEARAAQQLFNQFERQDIREMNLPAPSPASPPKPDNAPTFPEVPEVKLGQPFNYKLLTTGMSGGPQRLEWVETDEDQDAPLGSQARFEQFIDLGLEEYESKYGVTAAFGSQAYEGIERMASDDWRKEQAHVSNDIINDRAGLDRALSEGAPGILLDSRAAREGQVRPEPEGDSKYDIYKDTLTADIAAGYVQQGLTEKEAIRFARNSVSSVILELQGAARKALGKNATPQTVREWVFRQLRIDKHHSDVLDEIDWPRDEEGFIDPPTAAFDEALRREGEENGAVFEGFPDHPGLLDHMETVFSAKWIPVFGEQFIKDPMTGEPTIDLETGKPALGPSELKFKSLDDVHVAGQLIADPVAHAALFAVAQPVRAGELGFGEITGIETTAVSGALQSQLAEDILSEIISP